MLSVKPWKADAVMRLLLSLFVCVYAASLVGSVRHFAEDGGPAKAATFYSVAAASFSFLLATIVVLAKPWSLDNFMLRVAGLLICFYAGFFGGAWVQKVAGVPQPSIGQIIIASLGFHGAGLNLIWRFLRQQHISWSDSFGFSNQRRQAVVLGFSVALIFLPIGWGLQELSALAMTHAPHFKMEPKEQAAVEALRAASAWMPRIALGVMTIFLAPVTEEMIFRGILYPLIKQGGYPRLAFWGTSLLFAAAHVNLVTFVPLLALALLLTLLYERTDNLLAPITTHAMFNAVNFATLWFIRGK